MAEPKEAIDAIHAIAGAETAYDSALNRPGQRGLVGATKTMERARINAFKPMVGRKPTDDEKQQLCYGDA